MKGRAGRKGKDEVGETYLCCNRSDLEAVTQLMEAELPELQSCLSSEKPGINRCVSFLSVRWPLTGTVEKLNSYCVQSSAGDNNHPTRNDG